MENELLQYSMAVLKVRIHWWSLLAVLGHKNARLAHLGQFSTNRIITICDASPKVAKASNVGIFVAQNSQ